MRHSRRMGSRFVLRCMLDTKLRTKISTIIIDPNKISQPPQRCPFKNNVTTFHIMFNFFGEVNRAKLLYHLKKYFTIVSTQVQDPISHSHTNIYLGQDTTPSRHIRYSLRSKSISHATPPHETAGTPHDPPRRPDPARHGTPHPGTPLVVRLAHRRPHDARTENNPCATPTGPLTATQDQTSKDSLHLSPPSFAHPGRNHPATSSSAEITETPPRGWFTEMPSASR